MNYYFEVFFSVKPGRHLKVFLKILRMLFQSNLTEHHIQGNKKTSEKFGDESCCRENLNGFRKLDVLD